MARGITQSDVARAADALLLGGERPTVDRVRQFLGTGSPNTVTRLLDVWWKDLGMRLSKASAKLALPEAPESVATLASQLWEQALAAARDQANADLEAERAALAAARLETDARVAAAGQAAEASEARATEAAAALLTAHQRLEDRQRLADQQAQQLIDLAKQRDQSLARADQAGIDAHVLRERVDALLREADAAREAQAAHVRAVEERAHAEVDRARQETRERQTALTAAEKAHAARMRELEAELAASRTAAAESARALAVERARRETLERQLAEMHARLASAIASPPDRSRSATPRKARSRPKT